MTVGFWKFKLSSKAQEVESLVDACSTYSLATRDSCTEALQYNA